MEVDVYQVSLDSLNLQLKRLENTSNNVANINTPGYIAQDTFATMVDGQLVERTSMSTQQSSLDNTGRILDIAINGQGFFYLLDSGAPVLSKNGRFHINAQGLLAHSSGALLQGSQGNISAVPGDTLIKADGSVYVSGQHVDNIQVVVPESPQLLSSKGNNLLSLASFNISNVEPSLVQGALNRSSVNASAEMVKMMELNRTIQSSQKVIQAYDQLLNVGINELGKK